MSIKFTRTTQTIQEFLIKTFPVTDCNPIGQRPPLSFQVDNPKYVAIIKTILEGRDIGNITLVDVSPEESPWQLESLDGGNRKRSIYAYVNGKFRVNGIFFSELSEKDKEAFFSYNLSFTIYEPLSNHMKGENFRSLNTTTQVSDMEMLNSYGNIPIANAIRETVRFIEQNDGKTSARHKLFTSTSKSKFTYIKGNNLRLKQEEFVARVYYSFYKDGKLVNRVAKCVQSMYDDPNTDVKQLKKKADKFFDFLFEIGKARVARFNSGLDNSEKNALLNVYLYLSNKYGTDLQANNYTEWYKIFSTVYNDLYKDPYKNWTEVCDLKFEAKASTISQLFCDYTRNQDSADKMNQMVTWMTNHKEWNKIYEYTLLKDITRTFPRWMKETKMNEQGYVCYVDGLHLDWADAEAAHIKAHAKGGETVIDNCAMIRKIHNRDMGTMDVDEYKSMYLKAAA